MESPSPIEAIVQLIEEASSAVMAADLEDLTGLATAHTCFQQIAAEAAASGNSALRPRFEPPSLAAGKIVEQLILRELPDPDAALRSLAETVRSLQALVHETQGLPATHSPASPATPTAPAAPAASAPAPVTHPAPAHPAAVVHDLKESETTLNADDVPLALEFISEANSHIESAEGNLLKLEETPGDPEAVNAIFRSFHIVNGVAGFLNFKQIGALAHAAENLLDLARKGKLEIDGGIVDVVLESIDMLKILLGLLETAIKANQPMGSEPRLARLIDRLHAAASGESSGPRAEAKAAPDQTIPDAPTAKAEASHDDGTVKVSTERLDSLINMVGALVISQSMVSRDVTAVASTNQRVVRNLSHLGKITRELQDLSMSMRMVPIQGVFQKMARVVRDIARKAGKEVDFVVVGGETELDRNVVEAIGDPLVHMVRNSVDHGIEPPDQRVAAGKSRAGRLEVRARHQAGQIFIEIVDDGRGLNTEKILKKAIETGLVKADETLTEQQIFQLIFAAGRSTTDKITDISGRGVGMDVVRKDVEALRGRIDIQSVTGKGTTISVNLPLTMAVIDGMVVHVGTERYIIPLLSIEQSIRPKAEQLSTVQTKGEMCMVRERLLPLIRLHQLFNVKPRTENLAEAIVVIVQDNNRAACFLVDELLGQQQVVIKTLDDSIGTVRGVSGGAILGDGSTGLILDVPGLIALAEGN